MKSVFTIGNQRSDVQVFRRWSRKSYAAFASMNLQIKISNINTSYNLLVPSKECGFSGFCYLPDNEREVNEIDDLDLLGFELIEILLLQNENKNISKAKESGFWSNKILSAHSHLAANN
ncbi:hypothetical protein [Ancylomarina longa]|uniref:Uncharacterized protein n=1 Tax=Ancylomarina longa TaxID=2487017 RepID=A0A434AFT7_9BACT|nr:hypothetical protein [Ancylomarina longa]RUT73230.1 hypothetical protein DLK05_14220 [Ancylomarina longa]